ncbi:MAG: S1/P1 nuclease [Gluconacetobacter diazotrophicus]|nr:S1/P1 nuclease [Gluconacetobacter diazotrophicus]
MMTASVAYDQMTPAQRAWAVKVLEANPDFGKWKEMAPKDAPDFDFDRYVLMMAARWPDDIRKRREDPPDKPGNPYDHPKWHYVDFPLRPPDFPLDPPPAGTEDLFSAYAFCEKMVTAPDTSAVDRAAYLCWLLHLTGDIMQPLHAAALFNATYPDGDKGGNDFYVNLAGNSINLHSYWDGMGAVMMDYPEIVTHATDLEKKFPRSVLPELDTDKDVHAWALEGRQLAIDVVYRRGTLPGTRDKDQTVLPPLPGDYATKARALAERRIVLAGDRIAETIARLLPAKNG